MLYHLSEFRSSWLLGSIPLYLSSYQLVNIGLLPMPDCYKYMYSNCLSKEKKPFIAKQSSPSTVQRRAHINDMGQEESYDQLCEETLPPGCSMFQEALGSRSL